MSGPLKWLADQYMNSMANTVGPIVDAFRDKDWKKIAGTAYDELAPLPLQALTYSPEAEAGVFRVPIAEYKKTLLRRLKSPADESAVQKAFNKLVRRANNEPLEDGFTHYQARPGFESMQPSQIEYPVARFPDELQYGIRPRLKVVPRTITDIHTHPNHSPSPSFLDHAAYSNLDARSSRNTAVISPDKKYTGLYTHAGSRYPYSDYDSSRSINLEELAEEVGVPFDMYKENGEQWLNTVGQDLALAKLYKMSENSTRRDLFYDWDPEMERRVLDFVSRIK